MILNTFFLTKCKIFISFKPLYVSLICVFMISATSFTNIANPGVVKLVNSYSKSHILQTFIISKTLFCKAFLGTLKPMHFSFVTLLMVFDEFDHLHLTQPRGEDVMVKFDKF